MSGWWLAFGAFVAAAVAAEWGARAWLKWKRRYYVLPPGLRMQLHPDPEVFPQLPSTARFFVNREGERGDEVPASTNGLYRVLVAGGSQPEGLFLDQDTTWPGALQRRLSTQDALARLGATRAHVGCIARSGIGAEGLEVILRYVLPRYPRLQLIVILVGATDVLRWLELDTPDVFEPIRVGDVFRCHPDGPFGWTPGRLAVTELIARARRWYLRPLDVHPNAGRWVGRARNMRANAHTVYTTIRDPKPMFDHFETHFRRVLLMAKAQADRVIVIRQPWLDKEYSLEEAAAMWHGAIGQPWREEVRRYYSFDVLSRLMRALDERADTIARALGLEQIDLRPLLAPGLENYYDAFHPTDTGAHRIADVVAAAILRQPIPAVRPQSECVATA